MLEPLAHLGLFEYLVVLSVLAHLGLLEYLVVLGVLAHLGLFEYLVVLGVLDLPDQLFRKDSIVFAWKCDLS